MGDSAQRPRSSLLYVEDDADIAALTVEVLEDMYDVEHASDGETALRFALSRRYDVMVVDRRLPGMDGVDFIRALRRAFRADGGQKVSGARRESRGTGYVVKLEGVTCRSESP